MAAKKKEELTPDETPSLPDVETPLAELADAGPPDESAAAELPEFIADEAKSIPDDPPMSVDQAADLPDTGGGRESESALDIFADESPAAGGEAGAVEIVMPPDEPECAIPTEDAAPENFQPDEPPTPAKPKRVPRKKKAASGAAPAEDALSPAGRPEPDAPLLGEETAPSGEAASAGPEPGPKADVPSAIQPYPAASPKKDEAAAPRPRPAGPSILTIESGGAVETQADRDDVIWHEIHNAYRVRRVLTGQFCGVEQTENGRTLAIADYKGFRVVIPLREMLIDLPNRLTGSDYRDEMQRQNRLLGNMLGAEIDFVVRGIDSGERRTVASRRDAMLRKRQTFYFGTDANGMYRIYEGRIVQARVIAVAEKVIRVEAFGAECSIPARDLAWDWIGDAHERYAVGDKILVRIQSVQRDSLEDVRIRADVRSLNPDAGRAALDKCQLQSKYIGRITDVRKGVVFIRLTNGANAVAHSCFDYRTPGKQDDVSFVVTAIDEERGVATGIITRIIRQNL